MLLQANVFNNTANITDNVTTNSTNNNTKTEYQISVSQVKTDNGTSVVTKIVSNVDSKHKEAKESGETTHLINVAESGGSSICMCVFFITIIGLIGVGGIFYITKMQKKNSYENSSTESRSSSAGDTSHTPKQKNPKEKTETNTSEDNDADSVKSKKESADKPKDKVASKVEKNNNHTKGSKTKNKGKNKKKTVDLKNFDVTAASTTEKVVQSKTKRKK
uniref:Glycophorin-binding protein n=1 Tax=Strongyloides papillosus TaxID=174720 RepID=A0A0N5BRD8_STREA